MKKGSNIKICYDPKSLGIIRTIQVPKIGQIVERHIIHENTTTTEWIKITEDNIEEFQNLYLVDWVRPPLKPNTPYFGDWRDRNTSFRWYKQDELIKLNQITGPELVQFINNQSKTTQMTKNTNLAIHIVAFLLQSKKNTKIYKEIFEDVQPHKGTVEDIDPAGIPIETAQKLLDRLKKMPKNLKTVLESVVTNGAATPITKDEMSKEEQKTAETNAANITAEDTLPKDIKKVVNNKEDTVAIDNAKLPITELGIAEKIIKGEKLTPKEEQFRQNNAENIETLLKAAKDTEKGPKQANSSTQPTKKGNTTTEKKEVKNEPKKGQKQPNTLNKEQQKAKEKQNAHKSEHPYSKATMTPVAKKGSSMSILAYLMKPVMPAKAFNALFKDVKPVEGKIKDLKYGEIPENVATALMELRAEIKKADKKKDLPAEEVRISYHDKTGKARTRSGGQIKVSTVLQMSIDVADRKKKAADLATLEKETAKKKSETKIAAEKAAEERKAHQERMHQMEVEKAEEWAKNNPDKKPKGKKNSAPTKPNKGKVTNKVPNPPKTNPKKFAETKPTQLSSNVNSEIPWETNPEEFMLPAKNSWGFRRKVGFEYQKNMAPIREKPLIVRATFNKEGTKLLPDNDKKAVSKVQVIIIHNSGLVSDWITNKSLGKLSNVLWPQEWGLFDLKKANKTLLGKRIEKLNWLENIADKAIQYKDRIVAKVTNRKKAAEGKRDPNTKVLYLKDPKTGAIDMVTEGDSKKFLDKGFTKVTKKDYIMYNNEVVVTDEKGNQTRHNRAKALGMLKANPKLRIHDPSIPKGLPKQDNPPMKDSMGVISIQANRKRYLVSPNGHEYLIVNSKNSKEGTVYKTKANRIVERWKNWTIVQKDFTGEVSIIDKPKRLQGAVETTKPAPQVNKRGKKSKGRNFLIEYMQSTIGKWFKGNAFVKEDGSPKTLSKEEIQEGKEKYLKNQKESQEKQSKADKKAATDKKSKEQQKKRKELIKDKNNRPARKGKSDGLGTPKTNTPPKGVGDQSARKKSNRPKDAQSTPNPKKNWSKKNDSKKPKREVVNNGKHLKVVHRSTTN